MLRCAALSPYDTIHRICEIDNALRGNGTTPQGSMSKVLELMMDLAYHVLDPIAIESRVLADNVKTIALYYRLGFAHPGLIPFAALAEYTMW